MNSKERTITEDELAELEANYILEHGITSRDGYIPQSFDEIGNVALRELVIKDFEKCMRKK